MEIAIVSKAKQGYIYRYMIENNMSVRELAERIGINQCEMGRVINFKWIPPRRKVKISIVERLENYFHLPIEVLFPPELTREIAEKLSKKHVEIKEVEMIALQDCDTKYLSYNPEEGMGYEQKDLINKGLATLKPCEEDIIRRRFGLEPYDTPQTLREIAIVYGKTYQRIRQIEVRALKKCQHLKRRSIFEGYDYRPEEERPTPPVKPRRHPLRPI